MLVKFELKKIFHRKLNLISMLGGFVVLALCIIVPINDEWYDRWSANEMEELTGIEAIKAQWEFSQSQTEYITDEFVRNEISKIQTSGIDIESDDGYVELVRPNGLLMYFLARSFTDISASDNYTLGILNDLDDSISFYDNRMQLIEQHLNKDFSFGNYKEVEKEYWQKKADCVTTPFKWGDKTIPNMMLTIISLAFYEFFVITICLSSIFAGEKESGVDQILFATKYGKGKLIYAKIVAANTFSVAYVLFCTALGICIIGGIFGFESLGLPIQLLDAKIPYNFTMLQAMLLQMLVTIAVTLFVTAFVCMLSAFTRSSIATMVMVLVWLIGPAFISASKTNRLFNYINYLFAVRLIEIKNVLGFYIDYCIGNIVIDYVTVGILVHLILASILTLFMKKVTLRRGVC